MEAVDPYAQDCRERKFLWGFHNDTISHDGDPFHLGASECAIVEAALRHIETGQSLVLHNPFPTTALPVALIASYAYSEHPSIPGGDGRPMLTFPASSQGYVGELDEFHFQNTATATENNTPLIPREPINALSEQSSDWGVYTANSGFLFDDHDADLGAMFVDLQKPEWSERVFDRIEEFCENHPDVPTIFYTDELGPAAELTIERLGRDPVRVTNNLLASAESTNEAPGESDLTTQERILSDEVTIRQFPVTGDSFGGKLSRFIDLKNKCQDRDLAYVEVSRVFNRLTKQPFKPNYWTRTVGSNGFYEDVPGYLERIQQRADTIENGGNLLSTYARLANEIQGHLNDNHALQNTVLDAIQRAGAEDSESVFVVKNSAEKEALRLAATDSGYTIPENVTITERANLIPRPGVRHVFLYPPYEDDYVYEFPPSNDVAFIHHALWSNYVRATAQETLNDVSVTHHTTSIGTEGAVGDVDDHVFDIDSLESDIEGYLRRTSFGTPDQSDEAGSSRSGAEGEEDASDSVSPQLVFRYSSGKTQVMSVDRSVTVYDDDTASIARKKARNVETGDEVLLINSVAGDLYDVLIESAHKREAVRDDEQLVENWRSALETGMERKGYSAEDVVEALQDRGSDLESPASVNGWQTDKYIGPRDEGDCRRVLQLFRPELEGALLEQIHEQVWKAMKHLRLLHRRIGRNVRRAVEAEFNPATHAEFDGDVNEQMIRNIARDIERKTVIEVKRADDDA